MTIDVDPGANAVGRMHADPRDTEKKAALDVAEISGRERRAVLDAIVAAYPDGLTDSESEVATGGCQTGVGARRNELMNAGWVEETEIRRPTSRGATGIVWRATPKALAFFGLPGGETYVGPLQARLFDE